MEKYRQFADGGTGVNPFVPPWSNYKASTALRLAKVLFIPVACLRLALFMIAIFWLVLTQLLCTVIVIGVLRRPVQRLLTFFGCALALFALGVFTVSETLADHRRLKLPPSKKKSGSCFDASRGTVVVANHQGLTDILYLGLKLCPTFVIPSSDGSPVEYTLVRALMRASGRRMAGPPLKPATLADIAKRAKASWQGPVVVFPEGARTNGTCVLAWRPTTFAGMDSFGKPIGTALLGIEYSKAGAYTAHHTVGTAFRHVFWMCMQPYQTLKSVWLPAEEVESAMASKPLPEQMALLRSLLVRMIPQAVEVEVGAAKHVEFLGFWDASQRRGYTAQQQQRKKA